MNVEIKHPMAPTIRCGCLILIVSLLLIPLRQAHAGEGEVLREIWYVSTIAGEETGSVCQRVCAVDGDDGAVYRTLTSATVVLERIGRERTVRSENWTIEDGEGRVLRIHHREIDSGHETICDVAAEGDEAALTLTSVGEPESSTVSWDRSLLGPVGIQKLRREKGFAAGTNYSYKMFSPDYAKAITVSVFVKGSAETELLDRRRATLIHVTNTIDLLPGVVVNEWWDEEGETIKTSITMMGKRRESFLTTAERATHAEQTEFKADLLLEAVSHSDINLPNPYRLDSILYAIEATKGEIDLPAGIDDIRQKTIDSDGRGATLLVRALNPKGFQKRPLANRSDAIAPYLEPNPFLQCGDETLGKAAARIVGRERDAWKAAQRLERFVFEHITEKKLGTAFASAAEVFEQRSGDSTEHAVLLACLCRSQGIPARVAMGFMYLGGVFGGHMWTEVWINGHWYALDGVMGMGRVDPTHIRLASSSLNEGRLGEAFLSALRGLGDLDIKVLEFTRRDATVTVGKNFKDYAIDGDRYTNTLYGISFTKPADHRFVHYERDFSAMTFTLVSLKGSTEMVLKAMPAAYSFSMGDFKQRIKSQGGLVSSVLDVEIDRRPAKVFVTESKGQRRRILVLVEHDTCYVFEALIDEAARDTRVFERVIASIEFVED